MQTFLPEAFLRYRHAKLVLIALCAALGFVLIWIVSGLIWTVLLWGGDSESTVSPMPSQLLQQALPQAALSQWNLFGNANPAADLRAANSAPDTNLKLRLHGVFAADDPKQGYALISDEAGNQASYLVGTEVPGGALVDSVYVDRVVLSRNGALENLRLPAPDENTNAGASVAPRSSASSPTNQPPASATTSAPQFVTPIIAPGKIDMASINARLGVDVAEVAKQVSVLPVMENGEFVGVRVYAGRDMELINKLGLKAEDIVTQVNGIAVTSPDRAQEILASLQSSKSISVTVRRDGREQKLSVTLP